MSDLILDLLNALRQVVLKHMAAQHPFRWAVGPVTQKETSTMPLDITINDQEKIKVTLVPDGPVDGEPLWSVKTGNSTLMVDPGGMSAYLISEDNVMAAMADTEYEVSADVDLGSGVVPLNDQIILHVTPMPASTLGLQVASPEPK